MHVCLYACMCVQVHQTIYVTLQYISSMFNFEPALLACTIPSQLNEGILSSNADAVLEWLERQNSDDIVRCGLIIPDLTEQHQLAIVAVLKQACNDISDINDHGACVLPLDARVTDPAVKLWANSCCSALFGVHGHAELLARCRHECAVYRESLLLQWFASLPIDSLSRGGDVSPPQAPLPFCTYSPAPAGPAVDCLVRVMTLPLVDARVWSMPQGSLFDKYALLFPFHCMRARRWEQA